MERGGFRATKACSGAAMGRREVEQQALQGFRKPKLSPFQAVQTHIFSPPAAGGLQGDGQFPEQRPGTGRRSAEYVIVAPEKRRRDRRSEGAVFICGGTFSKPKGLAIQRGFLGP